MPLFIGLTLAWSWGWWSLLWSYGGQGVLRQGAPAEAFLIAAVGGCGPSLAALALTALLQGRAGLAQLRRRFGLWRLGRVWLLLGVAPLASLLLPLLRTVAGAPLDAAGWLDLLLPGLLLGAVAGAMEEVGWRGFLLTREVEAAVDLEAFLYDPARLPVVYPREALADAGRAVRRLHDAGVSHADLHPKNLLVAGRTGEILVLDLDRARAFDGLLPDEERLSNLVRLGRAVEKHRLRGMRVGRRAALRFLTGYAGDPAAAAPLLARVRARLARGLAWHVLWWKLTGQARPRALPAPARPELA